MIRPLTYDNHVRHHVDVDDNPPPLPPPSPPTISGKYRPLRLILPRPRAARSPNAPPLPRYRLPFLPSLTLNAPYRRPHHTPYYWYLVYLRYDTESKAKVFCCTPVYTVVTTAVHHGLRYDGIFNTGNTAVKLQFYTRRPCLPVRYCCTRYFTPPANVGCVLQSRRSADGSQIKPAEHRVSRPERQRKVP